MSNIEKPAPDYSCIPGRFGQTWMLSGWVESGGNNELKILAMQAYKTLSYRGWQYQEKGHFLGAPVLYFWRSSPQQWENMERDSHLTIVLYPNQKAMLNGADFYEYCKHLF